MNRSQWLGCSSMFAFALALPASASAGDAKCFPTCRSGFVCSPQGQCVTACNPPCGANETCSEQGECLGKASAAATPRRPSEAGETDRSAGREDPRPAEDEPLSPSDRREATNSNYVAIGGTALVASGSIAGFTVAAGHAFGETHALLLGLRTGVYFAGGASAPLVGFDVGYRGWFYTGGTMRAGFFTVGQFQAYIDSAALIFGGLALGPVLEFGPFHVQVPLGGGIVKASATVWGVTQTLTAVAGQFGLLGGIAF